MKYARVADKDSEVQSYIDKNKLYEISEYNGRSFTISKEQFSTGAFSYCLVDRCSHLLGGKWELFEELPETETQPMEERK